MSSLFQRFALWVWLVVCSSGMARGQSVLEGDRLRHFMQQAEAALLEKNYPKALRYFDKALKLRPGYSAARRGKGACYELMGRYPEAAALYEAILADYPEFSKSLYFDLARVHFRLGNYARALELFEQFRVFGESGAAVFSDRSPREQEYLKQCYEQLPEQIRLVQVAMDVAKFRQVEEVLNLGPGVNTAADEYFPWVTRDGQTMFYTSRLDESDDEDIFVARRTRKGWTEGAPVGGAVQSSMNEGMTSFLRNGRRVYFTACQRREVLGPCDLWQANVQGTRLTDVGPVTGYVNSAEWESQAAISCDGGTLYFASTRPGGYGGSDLYVCHRLPDGRWGKPENLGPTINTEGDEEAPYLTPDGKVLYFSSDGHPGLGEQDLFMSRLGEDGSWSEPVNLGEPVNSGARELGIFISADGLEAFFASDRAGGYGGMDIYHFLLPQALLAEPITFVEGQVLDSVLRVPVQCMVQVAGRPPVEAGPDGKFFLCAPADSYVHLTIEVDDYYRYQRSFYIPEWDNARFFPIEILLEPTFRLPKVAPTVEVTFAERSEGAEEARHTLLFGFDQATLDPDARFELDRFLNSMLDGRHIVSIEIIGYTDDSGDAAYNLQLSERRARAVAVHLKRRGLRVDEIHLEGKGATRNDRPRWANRKVEVVVRWKPAEEDGL